MYNIERGQHHINQAIKFLSKTAMYEIPKDHYNASKITKEINRLILLEKRLGKIKLKK